MLALLMCGGKGVRLKSGEKPLFRVCGKMLIEHAIEQLSNHKIIAVASPFVPETKNYLKEVGIDFYEAKGAGFVEDFLEAFSVLSIKGAALIVASDIVYFRCNVIDDIVAYYKKSNKPALKVVKNEEPVGINIVHAEISGEQEEEIYRVTENDLFNINTLEDARKVEELWATMRKGLSLQRG